MRRLVETYAPPPLQYTANPQLMQTAYFTTTPPPFIPLPATIHVPSPHVPSPQQPPPYLQYNAGKKRRKGQGMRIQGGGANHWQRDQPYSGGVRGGGIPENPAYYNQPHGGAGRNPAATQWNHGGGARGGGNNQWHQDGGGQRGVERQPHSNTRKVNINLLYCYFCGYDVDHAGWQCQYGCFSYIVIAIRHGQRHIRSSSSRVS